MTRKKNTSEKLSNQTKKVTVKSAGALFSFINIKLPCFLSLGKVLMRQTFGPEKTFNNMLMIETSLCILKLRPVGNNMQWLLDSFYSALALSSIPHSAHYPLHILDYNVPEEFGQLPLRFLRPLFHKAITFRGRWAPPSEVTHPIGSIFSLLHAQL